VKRPLTWLCLSLALCLACGREKPTVQQPAIPVDDSPRDGGTLIRCLNADIVTVNPVIASSRYDSYVAQYLFTPILYVDRNLKPVPALAKSWSVSDDGRVYRFELNPKATFSDGTPVLASDVLFTLRKIVDPASEAVQIVGSFELLDLTHTRVIDDHTIEVAFREPLASQLMRFRDVYVLPEHVYGKGEFRNDYNSTAVGNGPYKLVRRVSGKEVVLERRNDYWGERPHIQTVVFKIINDHNTAWNALKRQEIDETLIASDTWLREHNNPELAKYIDFRRFYTLNYSYIAWNGRNPLLSDKRVRRALAMCIPTDAVVNDLFHGTARAMSGQFTPDEWAYNPTVPVIRYDPEGAKKILESLGWIDGDGDGVLDNGKRKFAFDFISLSGSATGSQLVQMVQAEMKKVGIQVDLVTLDGATGIQRVVSGNYDAAYLGWDLDPDPDPYALFHSSQFPPHGQNFVFYSSEEADRLIDAARRELDESKRKDLYWRLHEVLSADQPYTWVVQASAKWGINKRVRGVEASPGFGLFLWYPGELGWWIASAPQR
jgi:peptide/nickel transport system substrate-binding protein